MAELRGAVGAEVRAERARQRLTQAGLAQRAQVARSYLSQIEAGQVDAGLSVLTRLAGALGLTVDELLRRARQERDRNV